MGSINTQGQIAGLTIKDMVRQVALNLRASSRVVDNGYEVEVRDYSEDSFTRITIERAKEVVNASNLSVANGKLKDMKVRYAYYASDNPLASGQTLAAGEMGAEGVRPTYMVTKVILEKIFS